MATVLTRPSRPSRRETVRRVTGSLLEIGIKAYGAAAALSVALSDGETVAGKGEDALAAVPNLMERYQNAKYVIDHREEIRTALDHVHHNAVDADQLEAAAEASTETLVDIETTYDEAGRAWDAITNWNVLEGVPEAAEHAANAWQSRPDFDSISHLADVADNVVPFVRQVEVLVPAFYGGVLTVADNFASDEIGSTLAVMGAALAIAFVLGTAVGFWARRGRPGLLAHTLQAWGAHRFHGWYVRNLEYALGEPLYAAARERTQGDILADPQGALDPEAFRELELYFANRLRGD